MKTALMFSAALAVMPLALAAGETPAGQRDAQVVAKMLEAALSTDKKASEFWSPRSARIEPVYLAGQGMLFTVQLSRSAVPSALRLAHRMVPPVAPVAPVAPVIAGAATPAPMPMPSPTPAYPSADLAREQALLALEYANNDFDDISSFVEDVLEGGDDDRRLQMSARNRALQDKMRELQAAREQMHRQMEKHSEQMEALSEKLAAKDAATREKARTEMEKNTAAINNLQKEFNTRVRKFAEEENKRWQAAVTSIQDKLLDALCDYAGSVRKLPANEHVSFLFRGTSTSEDSTDQVFIFKRADLDACATGNQSDGFLRKRANSYGI